MFLGLTAVLFDLDNTVYGYDECHEGGLRQSFEVGRNLHENFGTFQKFCLAYEAAKNQVKLPLKGKAAGHCRFLYFKNQIESAFGRTMYHETANLHNAYWEGYFAKMVIEPGSKELLTRLRDKGVPTAWVTNFTTERQFQKLERLGLIDATDFLVSSEEVGSEKPTPEGIYRALKLLGIQPSPSVILVGDNLGEDREAASTAGVGFIWYRKNSIIELNNQHSFPSAKSWHQLKELLL